MRCPPKRVPSADHFFSHCRPTVQPPQSYSVGGQRRCGQLTGKPTGARPDHRGRWCAVSRGHPGRPKPSPLAPWELPSTVGSGIAWTRTGDLQAIGRILHSMRSTFTRCAAREPLSTSLFNSFYAFGTGNKCRIKRQDAYILYGENPGPRLSVSSFPPVDLTEVDCTRCVTQEPPVVIISSLV
ncbi:UNVERIFIED_CONTAM: hypothetical protein FKN15_015419 [Acipenser sinensis]